MRAYGVALLTLLAVGAFTTPAFADSTTGGAFTGLVQIAVSDNRVYALRKNGNVLLKDGDDDFRMYDSGTGTKQIAVDGDICYVLKPMADSGAAQPRAPSGKRSTTAPAPGRSLPRPEASTC